MQEADSRVHQDRGVHPEAADRLQRHLGGISIVPVLAKSGRGMDHLKTALEHLRGRVRSVEEMASLREAGLTLYYLGIESGHDRVLALLNKGVDSEEMIDCGRKVARAGVRLSVMILLVALRLFLGLTWRPDEIYSVTLL